MDRAVRTKRLLDAYGQTDAEEAGITLRDEPALSRSGLQVDASSRYRDGGTP